MVKITYVAVDGTETAVQARVGQSVMEAAVKNVAPGIVGECGGSCACGTCRVYVDHAWRGKVGGQNEMEQEMIGFSGEVDPSARLSCQIRVTEELDGLIVRTPVSQY